MTDDDEVDPSDWLAQQFGEQTVQRPAAAAPPPVVPAAPPVVPPGAPPEVPPAARSSSDGGFSWGLLPGGAASAPAAEPPPTQAFTPPPPRALEPPPTQAVAVPPPLIPPPAVDVPTEAFSLASLDPAIEGVTEALAPHPLGLPDPVDESPETSAIDSLFGETAFLEYHEQPPFAGPPPSAGPPAPAAVPTPGGPGQDLVVVPHAPKAPSAPITRTQKILMWVAGGLAASLALVALFVLGTRISGAFPAPAVVAPPSASPSVAAVPLVGPLAPGSYRWDQLLGGECLQPFESAWQDEYTVVDCTAAHAAQLLIRGTFDDAPDAAYPGVEDLQARMALLCTAPTIVDYAVAGTVSDLQITASYAADAGDWDGGNREYFCFANRSGAEPLTGSVVLPPAPPAP